MHLCYINRFERIKMQLSIILAVIISMLAVRTDLTDSFHLVIPGETGWLDIVSRLLLICLIYTLWLFIYTRKHLLRSKSSHNNIASSVFGRVRLITVITITVIVLAAGWGRFCAGFENSLVQELTAIIPLVVLLSLELIFCYKLDIALRHNMVWHATDNPLWTLSEYLIYHLRHNLLIVLVPLFFISLFEDISTRALMALSGKLNFSADLIIENEILSLLGVLLIFIFAGPMIRCIWKTSPMPDGPLRQELEDFCKKVKLSYRDILIWHTWGMTANAAVTGISGPLRYIIVSDRLLATMSPAQLIAVFGHEAAHIRLRHIPWLFAGVLAITSTGSVSLNYLLELIPEQTNNLLVECISLVLLAAVIIGGIMLFSCLSRHLERQADVFAAQAIGEHENDRNSNIASPNDKLSAIGSALMSSTLNRLAVTNNISTAKSSWRHGSLSDRMALLYELAVIPGAMVNFQRKIKLIKLTILALLLLNIILSL